MVNGGYISDERFVFFALSTDKFPVVWDGMPVPTGSDLYLTDTNRHLSWNGSIWYDLDLITNTQQVQNLDPIIDLLQTLVQEQRETQELLSELLT